MSERSADLIGRSAAFRGKSGTGRRPYVKGPRRPRQSEYHGRLEYESVKLAVMEKVIQARYTRTECFDPMSRCRWRRCSG